MSNQLNKIKRLLIDGQYLFSIHADVGLADSGLTRLDAVESVINAPGWYKREKYKGLYKYTFNSPTYDNVWVYSVGRVIEDEDETYYFYITSHRSE